MGRTIVTRTIAAPVHVVFKAVSDPSEFAKALPHVQKVEHLTPVRTGAGARFRETRLMKGKEHVNELEVTEHVENDHVRMVAVTHGTTWDTLFTTRPSGAGTELTATMDWHGGPLLQRAMISMFTGMVKKAIEADLDLVKARCEGSAPKPIA